MHGSEKPEVQVMEIRKTVFGLEHSSALTSMVNLTFTYRNHGRLTEAENRDEDGILKERGWKYHQKVHKTHCFYSVQNLDDPCNCRCTTDTITSEKWFQMILKMRNRKSLPCFSDNVYLGSLLVILYKLYLSLVSLCNQLKNQDKQRKIKPSDESVFPIDKLILEIEE
jgi:hypothetical protein